MDNSLEEFVTEYTKDLENNSDSFNRIIDKPSTSTQSIDQNETGSNIIDSQESELKKPMTLFYKYYLFCFFVCMYFLYGASESFLGPALSDLAKLFNTDAEHISYFFSFRNFVYCFSMILVSFSFEYFGNRQMQYSLAIFFVGLTCGLTPFLKSFKQFIAVYFFSGLATAIIDSVTTLVVLEIFSSNSKVYVQITHSAYTVGSVFGPLLISPFLSKENSTVNSNEHLFKPSYSFSNLLANLNNETINKNSGSDSNIEIPYLIISSLLIFGSIFFIITQLIYPYIPEKRILVAKNKITRQVNSSSNQSNNSINNSDNIDTNSTLKSETVIQKINLPKSYYFIFLGLIGLMMSTYNCLETTTSLFMPSYLSKGELNIDKKDAAFMTSILYMAMASGRIMTVLLAFRLTCKNMLFFNLSLVLTGYTILLFFAKNSNLLTWITMFVLGFGYSSTYPLIFSFIENRVIISNNVQLYLLFSSGIFILFVPIVIGHYIYTMPAIFTYANSILAVVTYILLLFIHSVDVWKKKLIKKIKEDQESLVEN